MNNFPQVSDIILQTFVALLTLITGLITAYFAFRLGQQKKSKSDTKLGIIRAVTSEIRKYSEQIKSIGENKDLLDYIIYKLPIKVNELTADISRLQVEGKSLANKSKISLALNVCILFLQIVFYYIFDLQPIYSVVLFSIISILLFLAFALEVFILVRYFRVIKAYRKNVRSFIDELDKIEGTRRISSIGQDKLIEFIRQRNKLGFGTSLNNIKNELESYGIKVSDAEIIRSHLNLSYSDNPEGRRNILLAFYFDGKTHESFNELSDEEILSFTEFVKKNSAISEGKVNGQDS